MKLYVSMIAALLLASSPVLAFDQGLIDHVDGTREAAKEGLAFVNEFDCAGIVQSTDDSCDERQTALLKAFDELIDLIDLTKNEYTEGRIGDMDSRWRDIGDQSRITFQEFESFKEDFNN